MLTSSHIASKSPTKKKKKSTSLFELLNPESNLGDSGVLSKEVDLVLVLGKTEVVLAVEGEVAVVGDAPAVEHSAVGSGTRVRDGQA